MSALTVALIGNPNTGKTTLFNRMTGLRQKIANWPGVTVEKKTGAFRLGELSGTVVDLPGIYSLVPAEAAEDERVARAYLAAREADVVVDIADAANLERHLYLTVQLLEQGYPVVLVLNMADIAQAGGVAIDTDALAERLGCPVVAMTASSGKGLAALEAAIRARAEPPAGTQRDLVDHGPELERAIAELAGVMQNAGTPQVEARRRAIRLLEGDRLEQEQLAPAARAKLEARIAALEEGSGEPADLLLAEGRYGFIMSVANAVVRRRLKLSRATSDGLDRVALHRIFGLPIFFGVMYLLFTWTISVGGAFIDFFDIFAATLFIDGARELLGAVAAPEWFKVIVADGVGGGITTVATFIPIIGCLFLFLAVLEDSGYMSRAAFVMDRFMRAIGLPGKAFLPLLVGFGCNVPAVMATRTLSDPRDRKTTVLMIPFMSCGARVPVYALFAAAFFPVNGQNLVFVLYIIGIAVAIMTGYVLKRTLLQGPAASATIIELPRYHVPTVRNVLTRTWDRLRAFVRGAGKVIVVMVMVLSVLSAVSRDGEFGDVAAADSVLADIGRAITPAFTPMGIEEENWPATVGLFTGLLAKEAVVGTLDNLYGALAEGPAVDGEAAPYSLTGGVAEAFATIPENLGGLFGMLRDPLAVDIGDVSTPETAAAEQEVATGTFGAMVERFDGRVGAFAYLLFVLLYVPCLAAMGAVYREIGGAWTLFTFAWTTGLAYGVATVFYQSFQLGRDPAGAGGWIAAMLGAFGAAVLVMRWLGARDAKRAARLRPAG